MSFSVIIFFGRKEKKKKFHNNIRKKHISLLIQSKFNSNLVLIIKIINSHGDFNVFKKLILVDDFIV